jgi:hypothetical protein
MIAESSATSTLKPPETKTSVLITISTPGIETAICRLGNSEEVVRGLTVRDLVQRVVSPSSLFSVGVPISQLQAESAAALAIGELVAADCCQVVIPGKGGMPDQAITLDQLARAVAREQTGSQGNRFLNINLEVRSTADGVAPAGEDRRQVPAPPAVEAEPSAAKPVVPATSFVPQWQPASDNVRSDEAEIAEPASDVTSLVDDLVRSMDDAGNGDADGAASPGVETSAVAPAGVAPVVAQPSASGILTIVAEKPTDEPKGQTHERKEYVRKADWLRAQFLPEVEALDFSGLFVGNLGLGIREEKARRTVVLADPARITEVLLRANGYRRSGEHAKALIGYQELVDMDGSNADFRFLLGKTLLALGQVEEAAQAFLRAKELGHDGAEKELSELKRTGHRPRTALGFLRFWKQ